jgi:hypothetical protein
MPVCVVPRSIGMKGLSLKDVRAEIVSLLDESAEQLESGDRNTAVSILVEAQFLLSDTIQHEMNEIE